MKAYKTYNELATDILRGMEIKLNTVYIKHIGDYNHEHAVYLTRIGNANKHKAKIRVIQKGEHVKNCIKITFNPDRYERQDIVNLVESKIRIIKHLLIGSCHSFVRLDILTNILSGVIGRNGLETPEAKAMLTRD